MRLFFCSTDQPTGVAATVANRRLLALLSMAWQPGQSGNPSGRPKANPYMDKLLEEHAIEAVNVILTAMRSDDEKMRVQAAKEILDRKYGKAAQSLTVGGDPDAPLINRIERVIVHSTDKDRSGI